MKAKFTLNQESIQNKFLNAARDIEFTGICPNCKIQIKMKNGSNICPFCKHVFNVTNIPHF